MKAAAIIPAYNEGDRIADTVRAARQIPGISEVIVIDDGSKDNTAEAAQSAGADQVITLKTNSGKGAALSAGMKATDADVLLLLDGDLGSSASGASALLDPVMSGQADMTIASPPPIARSGGFGFAVRIGRWGIKRFTGRIMQSPLSGQRAIRREIIDKIGGFNHRFGVEVGLTIDAIRMGYRVEEVPLEISHRVTGRSLRGFIHRGRQFLDIACVLARQARK